jgi:hypothetical protein
MKHGYWNLSGLHAKISIILKSIRGFQGSEALLIVGITDLVKGGHPIGLSPKGEAFGFSFQIRIFTVPYVDVHYST